MRRGAEARGELGGALGRAIRDRDAGESRAAQRDERRLDHLAGADQQRALVLERLEDLTGEIDRDARHRDRPRGDLRLAAHALGGREGAGEEAVQQRTARAGLGREAVRLLHLTEDLRLADHQRVDRRRDAEHVAHRVVVDVLVEDGVLRALLRERRRLAELAVEERAQAVTAGVEVVRGGDHLDAVAGGDQHRLVDLGRVHQLREPRQRVVDGEALAHLDGRRAVVHADQQDLHVTAPTPITDEEQEGEAERGAGRRLATAPAGGEARDDQRQVDRPRDHRPRRVRAADEEMPGLSLRPQHAGDDAAA